MLTDKWIVAGVDILRTLFTLYIFNQILLSIYYIMVSSPRYKEISNIVAMPNDHQTKRG